MELCLRPPPKADIWSTYEQSESFTLIRNQWIGRVTCCLQFTHLIQRISF